MGLLDRLLGRGKKAVGDVMGDTSMRREGTQAQGGMAEDRPAEHETQAQEAGESGAEYRSQEDDTSA